MFHSRNRFAKYLAVLRITAAGCMLYRGDVLIRCLLLAFIMFVLVQLWASTFGAAGRPVVAGLTLSQVLWYLVITESIIVSATRISQRIDEEVRSAVLAVQLQFIEEVLVPVARLCTIGQRVLVLVRLDQNTAEVTEAIETVESRTVLAKHVVHVS